MGRLADEIERNHGQLVKCSLTPLTLYIIPPQVTTLKCRRSSLIQSAMLRSQRKSSWSHLLVWWSKWPSLASLLSLTSDEVEEVRRGEEGFTQKNHALLMLKKWTSKEEATYGQLYHKLKIISPFQLANS